MELRVNGTPVTVSAGITVASALAELGAATRTSVTGETRAAWCGMGICFECRATIDGRVRRSCQVLCAPGMEVSTHG